MYDLQNNKLYYGIYIAKEVTIRKKLFISSMTITS